MNEVLVFGLVSGINIMARIKVETDDVYVLEWPLNMTLILGEDNMSRLYVSRYMPYSETSQISLRKQSVQTITICNQMYSQYYDQKVNSFREFEEMSKDQETIASDETDEDYSDYSTLNNSLEESDEDKPSVANIFPMDTTKIN